MMFRKLLGLGFMALLLFGLIGLVTNGSRASQETAWMQGYIAGQQAADGGEAGTTTVLPPTYSTGYGRGISHGFFFPKLIFLACLAPLFLIGFFMLMGKKHWKHKGGHWGHHSRWGHHRQKPPWMDGEDFSADDFSDEPVMKA